MLLHRILVAPLVFMLTDANTGKKVSVKEVIFDSAVADIQWLGHNQKTVLVQTTKGRLYRSTNSGEKWVDITDSLMPKVDSSEEGGSAPAPIMVDSLKKSPADPSIVLVAGREHTHFISTNSGETWRRIKQKAKIHTFTFHKTRSKWALLSTWTNACDAPKAGKKEEDSDTKEPCNHLLYITKDLGKTFTLVSSYIVQFSWGDAAHEQGDRIYFTHHRSKDGDQAKLYAWSQDVDFAFTDDGGKHITRLVQHGNKFMVSHSFIFVAKLHDPATQTVKLMVSSDKGKTFHQAVLPVDLEEKSYTILDTSEGVVMLHVNHGKNTGNVYISDKEGIRYSLSLPNNVRSNSGDCEFDKVLSLEGIYLANQLKTSETDEATSRKAESAEDAAAVEDEDAQGTEVDKRRQSAAKAKEESIIRTVISFDKGGMWSYLKAPRVDSLGKQIECPADRCWLHLNGVLNFHTYAPFYSTENAVGIIMGTGNVGSQLRFEQDQVNTYLSRDGGLTWMEVHKGAFIYEFGDHGGLLVMADDMRKTKQVVFSWNEGQSWYDFELSDQPLMVDNVVIEPNATSTKFLLYGTRGDVGAMYHLDFEALGQPLCKGVWAADSVSSDYETWRPSDGQSSEKCMLGKQVTYTRRKQTSECFNGEKFERPVNKKSCACTQEDYECDMGFMRQVGSLECKYAADGTLPAPPKCHSADYYYANAYRKVAGDTCEGGWEPAKVALPCPHLSKGAISVLGSIGIVAALMASITYASRSEKFKGFFANYGFDSFNSVKYSTIGSKTPATAMDEVGMRYDADFIEGDQDDFEDAPQLMAYSSSSASRRSEKPEPVRRGVDTAARSVPKLAKPPGGTAAPPEDDTADLL